MAAQDVRSLYYITHIDNVESIRSQGILSHSLIEDAGIHYKPVYDKAIVEFRRQRTTPDARSLWTYANLYFQPRNPMLYRVLRERPESEVAILAVRSDVLPLPGVYVSTGNAASPQSNLLPYKEAAKQLPQILKDTIGRHWWSEVDSSKRRIMAECLVPDSVPPEHIQTIYVANGDAQRLLRSQQSGEALQVVVQPDMFFAPLRTWRLTTTLSVVEGDMFLSRLQTLTVSVNCVGVMGKGLASRAKYQFPDVYVLYQDLCKKRTLRMGKPYLYRRESSYDYQLADDPSSMGPGQNKWFLLFPTKSHWREQSDIAGIEEGLRWVCEQYQQEHVESLAIPALGCGLGRLQWHNVGPLLCRYLRRLTVPVEIYLPAEKEIPDSELSTDFLLGENRG